jgi:hypothetical protein
MFREKEKKKKCLYGTEKRQVSLALGKAWTDYFNLSKEQAPDKKSIMHYERVIHKLQGQLRIYPSMFSIFKLFTSAFCRYNPEFFKEDVTEALLEKGVMKTIAIVESRMPLDKRPNMVQELIRRYNALLKYIAETGIASKSDVSANTPRADEANL